ncbi:MAG: porin family protein [Nitrospirota bacterium]
MLAPEISSAAVTYGTDLSYQQNSSVSGAATSDTAQERFGYYFDMLSAPNSKLTLTGIFRLDVINNTANTGNNSFELDPDVSVRMATRATQIGLGYRELNINNNVVVNGQAQTQTSKSTDMYVDSAFATGNLPAIRVRYDIRDQNQSTGNVQSSDTQSGDFHLSGNYRIGILSFNGDYDNQATKDKMTGITQDQTTVDAQVSAAKSIGSRLNLGAREDYNYTLSTNAGQSASRAYNSISELTASYIPIAGAQVSGSYLYRIAQDLLNTSGTGQTTENTYYGSASYAFPKYLRVYGSYILNNTDAGQVATSNSQILAGVDLNHHVGVFTFSSRYERRLDSNSSQGSASTSDSQDNVDWIISAHPSMFLNLALSESYVSSAASGGTGSSSNELRFLTNIGPVRNLSLNPYWDYTLSATSPGTSSTTNTELVVPVMYRLSLRQRLMMDFSDMYRMAWTGGSNAATTSTTQNNAVVRLSLARPLPGTMLTADAAYNTTSGTNTPSTSTSSYSVMGSWFDQPHALNFNIMYQPASVSPGTVGFAAQYSLGVRLRNLAVSLQARYNYSKVFSKDRNDSQAIYVSVSIRK